jgi:hypothetical protein
LEEATAIMPEYFTIGTMKGSFIHKLSSISASIIKQILLSQMRVPVINEKQVTGTSSDAITDDDEDERKEALIDFSRPSDYRTKAIEAKHSIESSKIEEARIASRLSTFESTSVESARNENTPYEGKCKLLEIYLHSTLFED